MSGARRFILCAVLVIAAVALIAAPAQAATEEQIQQSIEDGLAWLASMQNGDGSWGAYEMTAMTGFAVVKFEDYAFETGSDPFDPGYVYYDQVANGLEYLFANAEVLGPDLVRFTTFGGHETYTTGVALMAVSASRHPERVVGGAGPLAGWTFAEVAQGGVDYFATAQNPDGGWRYYLSNEPSDNSNTGYATLGLRYAEAFGATIPESVKTGLSSWIDLIQDPVNGDLDDGGSWYEPGWPWVNQLKTGNLLFEGAFVGDTSATQRMKDAIDYIERWWNDPTPDPGWKGWPASTPHAQAAYCLMKGLESLGIDRLDVDDDGVAELDWYGDMADAIVNAQDPDGGWPWDYWGDRILATCWNLLTLERVVPPLEIGIDIKPGSDPNSINPGKAGVIPVAILTTDTFDAATVDPATVRFGPAEAAPLRWAMEDADFDGDVDLVLHFLAQECGFTAGDTEGVLTAKTIEDRELVGADSVRIIPAK